MRTKIMGLLAIVLAVLLIAPPAGAGKLEKRAMGTITLTTATSALTYYSQTINALEYDYIGASVRIDISSGGGSGAGIITFEGSSDTLGVWETIPFITTTDSLNIVSSLAPSSTADLYYNMILSVVPINLEDFDEARFYLSGTEEGHMMTTFHVGNIWPYEYMRMKVVDTNWNCAAHVDGFWLLKK